MRKRTAVLFMAAAFLALGPLPASSQSLGVASIHGDEMKPHLRFLAGPEFKGRVTPSPEGAIAARYIAVIAREIGLKPMFQDGYFQEIPVEEPYVAARGSYLKLTTPRGKKSFELPEAFGPGLMFRQGKFEGKVVFVGYGLEAPKWKWNDYEGLDLKGKIAVLLDVTLPREHILKPEENDRLLRSRFIAALMHGASAVVTVISEEQEKRMAAGKEMFVSPSRPGFPGIETDLEMDLDDLPYVQVSVRHDTAVAILGMSREELAGLFEAVRKGERPAAREIADANLEISLAVDKRRLKTANVAGWIEGSDPVLKNEYVVISSHYDHVVARDGVIFPGADDNASGVVGMFEIAEAMMIERPRRSVIFIWHAAEEEGLIGAYNFVQHCPVPVEAISANLNLDMISRNETDQLHIIGAGSLSTELDKSLRDNAPRVGLTLDAPYNDPAHPEHFFFRSDHYPYVRYGIPGVWIFCGTTGDYHHAGDVEEKCDYAKMERVARLTYLAAMDIGNKPALLKLDADPRITKRGKDNMKIDWMEELRKAAIGK